MFSPVLAGGCAASTCCRATPHDLTGHKLEPVKSSIVRSRFRLKALLRADAKRRCSASWDRESRAVAALRPAGYSSGRGDCARGGCSARRWGSLAGGCLSCAGRAVLSECPAFDHACLCGFLAVSYVRSRLLFAACAPNRTACGMFRSCSAVGRDRHSCVLGCRAVIELGWFTSGLRVSLWRSRRVTGTWGTELRGGRGWRRGACASLRNRIGLAMLSAGSTLGLRAPDCAKESSTLWTLLRGWPSEEVRFTRRGCVGAGSPRRHPGTIGDLTGSDKRRPHCGWPGRSCGRSNIAVRTIA